jgi:hypothetical protein
MKAYTYVAILFYFCTFIIIDTTKASFGENLWEYILDIFERYYAIVKLEVSRLL